MVGRDERAIRRRGSEDIFRRQLANTKIVEPLFSDGIGMSFIRGDLPAVQQKQALVIRLKTIDIEPLRDRVVIGQRHEVESGVMRRVKDTMRRHRNDRAAVRRGAPVAMPRMRMQIAREPIRTCSHRRPTGIFVGREPHGNRVAPCTLMPPVRTNEVPPPCSV